MSNRSHDGAGSADPTARDQRLARGLRLRREVLGNNYVDTSMSDADELSRPLQELIVEYCWGEVWSRPGLDRRTRSLLNIAMLTALNRPHEVKLHLRGALNNDCSRQEICEVILQSAIYCGVPAALDTMRVAKAVLAEREG